MPHCPLFRIVYPEENSRLTQIPGPLAFFTFGYAYPVIEDLEAWVKLPQGGKIYGKPAQNIPYPLDWGFYFSNIPQAGLITPLKLIVSGRDACGKVVCDMRHFTILVTEYATTV